MRRWGFIYLQRHLVTRSTLRIFFRTEATGYRFRSSSSRSLLDIQLPDTSSEEAARQLQADEQTRAIPTIAVTGMQRSARSLPRRRHHLPLLTEIHDAICRKPTIFKFFLKYGM
jgi:CheY-like chemotaxis protein